MVNLNKEVERLKVHVEKVESANKELSKKLAGTVLTKTKKSASAFKNEFRKQTVTALTAAFAFLIAFAWRDAINDWIIKIVSQVGLSEQLVLYKFYSALIITLICVVFLVFLTRWSSKEENKNE